MRIWIFLIILFCGISSRAGMVKGFVHNDEGEPLAFASVYILGTTTGTASNPEGYFELPLPEGEYELVIQYIGYRQFHEVLQLGEETITLNVILEKGFLNELVFQSHI